MLLGIIICGVIMALALYDYFSTRNWQVVTSEERNEAVFEKRNKAYGAYQIRTNYNKRLLLILFGLTIGVGGLYGASLTIKHRVQKKDGGGIVVGQLDADEPKQDEPEVKKPVDKPVEQTQAQTYQFIEPKITDNQSAADTMNVPDPGKDAGTKDLNGKNPFDEPPFSDSAIIGDKKPVDPITDDNGVSLKVDEVAYFKGGREALIKYLTNAIDPNVQGNGTCRLKFIVGADGNITKVWITKKVTDCPECDKEAENAVKNMPAWEPGKSNGTPVNSYFYLPISFR